MKALFAGVFDPPTLGHLELIQRAAGLCERLYVGVSNNSAKHKLTFDLDTRCRFLLQAIEGLKTKGLQNIEVVVFSGLVVDYAEHLGVDVLVRGVRCAADFDYEYQMAAANRQMTGIETLLLPAAPEYMHLSSSLVREIAKGGRRLDGFVPPAIHDEVCMRLSQS